MLSKLLNDLAPKIGTVFDPHRTAYTVAETDALLGQLRDGRGYRSREVFLAADVFTADFPEAVAVFLHEHAHIFGHDGHRGFTDALTQLIEMVVRNRSDLDAYEAEWETSHKNVRKERKSIAADQTEDDWSWLEEKSEQELRELFRRIPPVGLRKLKTGTE